MPFLHGYYIQNADFHQLYAGTIIAGWPHWVTLTSAPRSHCSNSIFPTLVIILGDILEIPGSISAGNDNQATKHLFNSFKEHRPSWVEKSYTSNGTNLSAGRTSGMLLCQFSPEFCWVFSLGIFGFFPQ